MKTSEQTPLLRPMLWPISRYELPLLLWLLVLASCITFCSALLKDTKDTLVISLWGAEKIPLLRFWGVLPVALHFIFVYIRLCNCFSRQKLFTIILSSFLLFFGFFIFVLYPHREALAAPSLAEAMKGILPTAMHGLADLVHHWVISLFFICAELWTPVVFSLLFFGFLNDTTALVRANRFYPLLFGLSFGEIIAGYTMSNISSPSQPFILGTRAWETLFPLFIKIALFSMIAIVAIYWWINKRILPKYPDYDQHKLDERSSPTQLSAWKTIHLVFSSPYLLSVGALIVFRIVCFDLFDLSWKIELRQQFPDPLDFSAGTATISLWTGIVSFLMVLFVGRRALDRGWGFAAALLPLILLTAGVFYFGSLLFTNHLSLPRAGWILPWITLISGASLHIFGRGSLVSLYSPTKEIAYIPLDTERRVKGKAVIDVLAPFAGLFISSILLHGLLAFWTSPEIRIVYLSIVFVVFVLVWLLVIRKMERTFLQLTATMDH